MSQIKKVSVQCNLKEKFTIESDIRGHKIYVDQPQGMGGVDKGPTPLEYLFVSLGGCIASIARIVANQRGLKIENFKVDVSGDVDLDTLLGKSRENRAGFLKIIVKVSFDSDMTKEEKEKFLEEVDSRCPISDNISNLTPVEIILE
uniref:OsmC family peroxiredoxin n=1 Tax=candidate division WOR-3 bacterium TaxID=2052148 RepID=A0A7C3J6M0_UNCW3